MQETTSTLLWAIAEKYGGEIHIDQIFIDEAKVHLSMVEMERTETGIRIKPAHKNEWPADETRIDIIGSNGNNGEHYQEI